MSGPRDRRLTWIGMALLLLMVAVAACAGPGGAATPTAADATVGASDDAGSSAAAGCIDSDTAAIIQSLRDDPASAPSTIEERGDDLVAGLQRFTPPAEATTWRDDLVAAIESGDAPAVQALVQSIGSEVVLEFC
jgi:hypothetical protein